MGAGKYKHTVIFQHLNDSEEWEDYYTCRAYVNGLSGSEYWAARQTQQKNVVEFTVRYCSRLAPMDRPNSEAEYRILFNGNPYDIEYADNVQFKNREFKIRAVGA